MSLDDPTASPPRRSTALLIAAVMALIGIFMILHGLGMVSAAWFHPNPDAPSWVFTVIGLILLLASGLMVNTTHALPRKTVNALGYAILALSMVMMHWLVFYSDGASCSAETAGLTADLPGPICRSIMGLAVIVLDLILAAAALATLRTYRRS